MFRCIFFIIIISNHSKAEKRLGSSSQDAREVKNHPFFKDVDWKLVEKKLIEPPFKPIIDKSNATINFAKIFTDENPKETPIKNTKSLNYSNFTYIKKYIIFQTNLNNNFF